MDDVDPLLAGLNPDQARAASHGDGPLLIVAGAGTGKTTTLAARVAKLIADGADPSAVLLLTFTRRAAAEMQRRVDALLGRGEERTAAGRIWGGTFHAVAARLLRVHGRAIGLEPDFTILDRADTEDLLNLCRGGLDLPRDAVRFPKKGTCAAILSRVTNSGETLDEVLEARFPHCREHAARLRKLFDLYSERKEAQALLDYDDLLLFWEALVADPVAGPPVRDRFRHVLVDEYQDTNALQAGILRHLAPGGRGLTVVGDDAQAIYAFRAATVRNILDFPEQYPGTTVVPLEVNYRSTEAVLAVANAVIADAKERHEKTLRAVRPGGPRPRIVRCRDETDQTNHVVERILEHRESGLDLSRQAVLFRASHHSLALELELSRRDIPFHKYGGLRFIETAHVKDLLAFLRLAENPRDEISATRVLMLLPGVGRKTAERLVGHLADHGHRPSSLADAAPPPGGGETWGEFVTLVGRLSDGGNLEADVRRVRQFYVPIMETLYDHPPARRRDLEQLEALAPRYPDRTTFLAEVTLDPPSSTADVNAGKNADEEHLVLSTMHSAKGLEFDAVYVLNAVEGGIPSDQADGEAELEEERRLFYVAITRAKTHLYLYHPLRQYLRARGMGDGYGYAALTPFLNPAARDRCELLDASAELPDPAATAAPAKTTAEVRAGIRKRWS